MKAIGWASVLFLAAAVPATATALTIDPDERELYDNSIQCMAYFGIMAGIGDDDAVEDPKMVESGTKFLTIATLLADNDKDQVGRDFEAQMAKFLEIAGEPDNPDNVAKVQEIDNSCKTLDTLTDAMLNSDS